MIGSEIINGFRVLDLIIILSIANLITEQTIGRNLVFKFFKPQNYLNYSGIKKFILDILTCTNCLSVWISFIWLIIYSILHINCIKEQDIMLYIVVPSITLLSSYVIHKK